MPSFNDELTAFDDRFTVLRADTLEDVAGWMETNFGPWRPGISHVAADRDVARFARKNVGGISLATYRWQAGMDTHSDGGQDVLFIAFPLRGRIRMHLDGVGEVEPGPTQARVCRRSVAHSNTIPAGYASLSLVVPLDLLHKRAQAFYDWPDDKPLEFSPLIDLDQPAGAAVQGLARYMIQGLVANPATYENQLVEANLRDMVSGVLLANLDHNAANGRAIPCATPMPRTIRRAEDFMRANADMPITVEDLARAAGCGERALHDGFRRFRGKTPMMVLRDIRLEGARRDLERDIDSVTQIAFNWGFSNLGRFARAYTEKFGEKPSDTRRGAVAVLAPARSPAR